MIQHQKYKIIKLSIGVCSVLLGSVFVENSQFNILNKNNIIKANENKSEINIKVLHLNEYDDIIKEEIIKRNKKDILGDISRTDLIGQFKNSKYKYSGEFSYILDNYRKNQFDKNIIVDEHMGIIKVYYKRKNMDIFNLLSKQLEVTFEPDENNQIGINTEIEVAGILIERLAPPIPPIKTFPEPSVYCFNNPNSSECLAEEKEKQKIKEKEDKEEKEYQEKLKQHKIGDKELSTTLYGNKIRHFLIGIKPKVEKEKIHSYKTKYITDTNLKENEEKIIQEGKDTYKITVTKYKLNKTAENDKNELNKYFTIEEHSIHKNNNSIYDDKHITLFYTGGKKSYVNYPTLENNEITELAPEVTYEEGKDKIIAKGLPREKTDKKEIDYITEYVDDNKMLPTDETILIRKGTKGEEIITTSYILNPDDGSISEKVTKNVTQPINEIIKRGTGVTTDIQKGEDKIIEDITLPEGKIVVVEEGRVGKLHPDGKTIVEEAKPTVKRIGKPKTSKGIPLTHEIKDYKITFEDSEGEEIPKEEIDKEDSVYTNPKPKEYDENGNVVKYEVKRIETKYKADDKLDKGKEEIEDNGKESGVKIIKVGTKPTTKTEKIPFKEIAKETKEIAKGKERVTTEGKEGKKEITTTYIVDEKTGKIKEDKTTEKVIEKAIDKVVEKGIRDSIKIYITSDGKEIKDFDEKENKDKEGNRYTEPKFKEENQNGDKIYTIERIYTNKGSSTTQEKLPEAKIVIIKDDKGNKLKDFPISPDEDYKPDKEIEVDGKKYEYVEEKDKEYIYKEKEEDKKEIPQDNNKVKGNINKDNEEKITKNKEDLPKTSSSLLGLLGLTAIFGTRKRKK